MPPDPRSLRLWSLFILDQRLKVLRKRPDQGYFQALMNSHFAAVIYYLPIDSFLVVCFVVVAVANVVLTVPFVVLSIIPVG